MDRDVKEARLEIRHVELKSIVAIIEILSPPNKTVGSPGRKNYVDNRNATLASGAHWVEIDLLREGTASVDELATVHSDYRIMLSRATDRKRTYLWPMSVRQPLPTIGIPLRGKDPEAPLDLGKVMSAAYENGGYDLSIDYRKEPEPPLTADDKTWAHRLLREHGLR